VGSTLRRVPARATATLFILAIIGLQAWAVVDYRDDWPFASNSMFSFGREPDGHVYDLQLTVEVDGRWRRLAPADDLGAEDDESFRRLFFTRWYGSTDPDYPQRSFAHDDPAAFAARMSDFCREVESEMHDRDRQVEGLAIVLVELEPAGDHWAVTRERSVGRCTPIDRGFTAGVGQT
jgi:hypothetical protein